MNTLNVPSWLSIDGNRESPVAFLDIRGLGLDLSGAETQKKINSRLVALLEKNAPEKLAGPALIKIHVGEPDIWQRMRPEFAKASVDFLKSRGVDKIVTGDTTVIYSRARGGRENPPTNVEPYIKLARDHGWLELGVPFVVLDRSISSVKGVFEFAQDGADIPIEGPGRFPVARVGGGLDAAGCIVNNAHLTGHGVTGLALCVKSISMGFADRRGKSQMHLAYGPVFNDESCDKCGICATNCPEAALEHPDKNVPKIDEEKCIGCGQCMTDCPNGAIEMKPRKIENWLRGKDTINVRMADYFVGIMAGRWDKTVHVAHMVKITEGCDCLTGHQEAMSSDIGFLVGKNPFAVDRAAQTLLEETSGNNAKARELIDLQNKSDVYKYIESTHKLVTTPKIETVKL